jgi:DNA-directed RNA polymerase specialized sigma24 family protein
LPSVQRRIFQHVFLEQRSHIETYELIRAGEAPAISFREFLTELRATYQTVTGGRRGHLLREMAALPPPENEPETPDASAGEQRKLVERLLGALSPEDRVAVQLYVLDELPAEDVARVLALPNAKAVYNRVYRALAELRAQLEASGLQREDLL